MPRRKRAARSVPPTWRMPPATVKRGGTPRRVGVEFELQGLAVDELAGLVASTLGGAATPVSDAEFRIEVPGHGEYRVEVDFAYLKDMAKLKSLEDRDASTLRDVGVSVLESVSSLVVPCEIVAPPLPMIEVAEPMDALVAAVRNVGGQGTRHSPLYAFGVHLNVEPPNLDADTVAAYLKAFVCLFDWIVWAGDVDLSRRFMPFIDRYPSEYENRIVEPSYSPDWPALIDDYLEWNATRNRALDMLPMFADVDEERVCSRVDDDLVKPRPAFHYRLANSCIDEPDWSIADPWNRWLQIEHLANDPQALEDCCRAFAKDRERLLTSLDSKWRQEMQKWLID